MRIIRRDPFTHSDAIMQDQKRYHFPRLPTHKAIPKFWDLIAVLLTFSIIGVLLVNAGRMTLPYELGQPLPISLDPINLPHYAARSVLRMLLALVFSVVFSILIGTLAAKNKRAEQFIIPLVDILQSIPVLGYLSLTTVAFINLFQGSLLGPECAAIFMIFTSQAWNMILSIYQSVKTVPADLKEAARMFHLSPWQQFFRVELPFAMPSFLWNTMMSMSAGWFFVVACEAIPINQHHILLPGIGSYIAKAIVQTDHRAILWAIIAMFTVILIYDQILFRPLIKWSEKFSVQTEEQDASHTPWIMKLLLRSPWMQIIGNAIEQIFIRFINLKWPKAKKSNAPRAQKIQINFLGHLFSGGLVLLCSVLIYQLIVLIEKHITFQEILKVFLYGSYTTLRVFILIFLCSVVWVPVGVWVGLRPKVSRWVQPLVQFLAAFPANLLFPIFVGTIVAYQLNPNIWTAPLMILGTQWYILFNVIAGASSVPKDYIYVVNNFSVSGLLWWKRLAIPAIFPYFVTGALSAAGGAWNASILAEFVPWGSTTIKAKGLGAYISENTLSSDFPRIALGITVMCLFVIAFNRLLWQPLYRWAERKFQLV